MIYHVSKKGSDHNEGSKENPFLTINKAASIAVAGDNVIVHEGVYREWVNPKFSGLSNKRRITYKIFENDKVVIKGSEQIKDWENVEGNVWKTVLPNSFFGDYNPYTKTIFGDWLLTEEIRHLADIYLNGLSFYEADSYDEVKDAKEKKEIVDNWTNKTVPVHNVEQTKYVWHAKVDKKNTTIYANFQGKNPTKELVEINVRRSCFYPKTNHINYITVKGFEMAHAATPWAPPTADQPGLIGPNWSKGWVIEDNIIHDSKCSGISLGKEASTGDNYRSVRKDKSGYQYQLEAVFKAYYSGWSKENIGSHIVRNNTIYDCGQNGIVGHLGCVFSKIYNNHIYNIALKREFYGHEIAGIKLHAPIDVRVFNNRIHNCSLGLWCDWETQGAQISRNIFYENNRDLFIEVSHGPYIVDHNILASDYSIDNFSQGGAYINNLVLGKMRHEKVLDRSTQYHVPHSTKVAGFCFIYGGDDRFYNNIYSAKEGLEDVGTLHYKGYTTSLEEYIGTVDEKPGDVQRFTEIKQPVYINNNAYFNGAKAFQKENNNLVDNAYNPKFEIIEENNSVYLSCSLPDNYESIKGDIITTKKLNRVRIVDADFENPDGSDVCLNIDLLGNKKSNSSKLGPIENLKSGKNKIKIW